MKYFYKIEDNRLIRGSGTKLPADTIEFTKGEEPQELLDILEVEADAKAQLEAIQVARKAKVTAIDELVVTTEAGNVFQADNQSRANMVEALKAAEVLGLEKSNWKLADNTVVEVTVAEIEEALALGIVAKGQIILGE